MKKLQQTAAIMAVIMLPVIGIFDFPFLGLVYFVEKLPLSEFQVFQQEHGLIKTIT